MNFQFDEEQQALADSVAKIIEREYDFEARKRIVASDAGHSPSVWESMAEMGIILLPMSETAGGFGMGSLALFPVMEQIGRGLLVEPLVETLIAARLLDRLDASNQADLLASVAAGKAKLAFAHLEGNTSTDLLDLAVTASGSGDDIRLSGKKSMVILADSADKILVSASNGKAGDKSSVGLYLVDAQATGVTRRTMRTIDNHRACDIEFDNCPGQAVGAAGEGYAALEEALDFGTVLVCAEAVGAMAYANETTLEYLKTRQQFGTPIGAFQALQHRMVDMTISCEQARSITYLACDALDKAQNSEEGATNRRRLVSAAKIKVSDAAKHVGEEAIQLHGGMGMTNEMKVSHTFKRLTMIAAAFGDVDFHLERFAAAGR